MRHRGIKLEEARACSSVVYLSDTTQGHLRFTALLLIFLVPFLLFNRNRLPLQVDWIVERMTRDAFSLAARLEA